MSYTTVLERICGLLSWGPSKASGRIRNISREAAHEEPSRPMSDWELARAIREFRSAPASKDE
jgi:hypothetical protein